MSGIVLAFPERVAGTCVRCGRYTTRGKKEWTTRSTIWDASRIVHANKAECAPSPPPDDPDGGQPVLVAA